MTRPTPAPRFEPDHLRTIRLLRCPVPIWAAAQEHGEELIREFTLIAQGLRQGGQTDQVPVRLTDLIDQLTSDYGNLNSHTDLELAAAVEGGRDQIDLTIQAPPQLGPAAEHLNDLLDLADEYCRNGQHLLTLASPPDAVRFRHWYLDEVVRQLDGAEPRTWPDYVDPRGQAD
jgi:hypothetical protein